MVAVVAVGSLRLVGSTVTLRNMTTVAAIGDLLTAAAAAGGTPPG